jgi:hypothetical protein
LRNRNAIDLHFWKHAQQQQSNTRYQFPLGPVSAPVFSGDSLEAAAPGIGKPLQSGYASSVHVDRIDGSAPVRGMRRANQKTGRKHYFFPEALY